MADIPEPKRNWKPLLGFLLALAAVLCNFAVFMRPPGERAIPLLSLALAAVALIFLVAGIWRAFAQGRGKILSSVMGVFALLLCALTVFAYVQARKIPKAEGAPKVGEKAPDFTLTDSTGKQVSLAQLLAPTATAATSGVGGSPANAAAAMQGATSGVKPKAVLLIFYRGYW